MKNTHQIYLISDSTGETLDRIFLAIKAQFKNIEYKVLNVNKLFIKCLLNLIIIIHKLY